MAEDKNRQEKKLAKGVDKKANRRGAARLAAVQALYQMDIAGAGINDIFAEFESHWLGNEVEGDKYLPAEAAFFRDVVSGVVRDQAKLDPLIDDALSKGWPLKRIDAILRAVLRAGSYELEHRGVGICRRRPCFCRVRGDRHGQCGARPDRPPVSRRRVRAGVTRDRVSWQIVEAIHPAKTP
jgi:N utilization substance protein B